MFLIFSYSLCLLAGHILLPYLLPLFLFSPKLPWTEKGIKYTTPNPLPSLLLSSPFYCLSKQFLSPSPSSSWAQGARKLHLSLLLPAMWCHCCSPAQPSWSQSSPVQCPSNNRKALFSIGALQKFLLSKFYQLHLLVPNSLNTLFESLKVPYAVDLNCLPPNSLFYLPVA